MKLVTALVMALAVAVLAACGGTPDSRGDSTPAACQAALAVQLHQSEAGSTAARNAPLPAQCNGLSAAQVQQIAVQVASAGLQAALTGQTPAP